MILLLVGLPAVFLVLGSFSTADLPTEFSLAQMGFANFEAVWFDPATYDLFANTFVYVSGATAIGILVAAVLAWLVERTNVPGKIWIYAGVPMTLAVPGMLQAIAWVLLLSPKIGFINTLAQSAFGLSGPPFNIYSLGGMIFIEGLRLVPTAFLMLVPLLRSMDPVLEEAAAMSGANPSSTLRRVTIRLMLPGLLAVLIYQAMTALEVFEIPGILGMPAGIYVFATKIYAVLHSATGIPNYGQANALAFIYVVIAIGATYLYSRVIGRSERFTIITGKGYRPRETDLGRWRPWAFAAAFLFLTVSIILPFIALVYVSFLPFMQAPSATAFAHMSLQNYRALWETPQIGVVLWNTLWMVVLTATITVLFSFLVSLVIVRSRFRARKLLDQLAFMPHAIPGIVMGLAFLWVFLQADSFGIPIYGGIVSIAIAFSVSFMAYGTRSINAAILQIHKDLEEAAHVSGAPYWRTMWRVFFPLMLPTFVGVWIWAILHAVRQAGAPLILYEGAENQVLAVTIFDLWQNGVIGELSAMGIIWMGMMTVVSVTFSLVARRYGLTVR